MEQLADLMQAQVDKIKSIPSVLAIVPEENITAFLDEAIGSIFTVIANMPSPSILVTHVGTELGYRGEVQVWQHDFAWHLKLVGGSQQEYFNLFKELMDGETGNSGLSLLNDTIHESCDPLGIPDGAPKLRRTVDTEKNEYFVVTVTMTEKGG